MRQKTSTNIRFIFTYTVQIFTALTSVSYTIFSRELMNLATAQKQQKKEEGTIRI